MNNININNTRKAKIGLMQVTVDYSWTVEQCHEELLFLAEQCLKDRADLVFMPEAYQYKTARNDCSRQELVKKYAQEYKEKCAELAKKYKAYVAPWDYELDGEGNLYNTSYILDRQGIEIGRYRKVNTTRYENVVRGTDFPVFDLDFGKVGIMICFDNYFPESAEILSLNGAELILYPLYGDTLKTQWEIKLRARAIDNSVYVAPCQISPHPREEKFSFSGIVDPEGEVICRLNEDRTYKVVEIEPGKKVITNTSVSPNTCEDIKQYLLKSRNVEAYGPISEKRKVLDWDEIFFNREKGSWHKTVKMAAKVQTKF